MFEREPSLSVPLQIVSWPTKSIPLQMLPDDEGFPQVIALETVRGYYQFSRDPAFATSPFKVDTGAPVTVIKKSDWNVAGRLPQIRWLHEPGVPAQTNGLPGKTYTMGGVGGGTVDVYFARVCLRFFKASRPEDPILDVDLVAALDAEGKLNNTLLGLGGGAFQDGGLCLNGQTRTVHLVRI